MFDFANIPSRGSYENTAYDAAALAGSTRRKERRRKLSTTKGEAKGKYKYVSYCPICESKSMVDPETHPHAIVALSQRIASCKNGHQWRTV